MTYQIFPANRAHPDAHNEPFVEPGEVFCRVFYLDGHVAEFRKPAPFLIAGE